jgi:hypothetical protein
VSKLIHTCSIKESEATIDSSIECISCLLDVLVCNKISKIANQKTLMTQIKKANSPSPLITSRSMGAQQERQTTERSTNRQRERERNTKRDTDTDRGEWGRYDAYHPSCHSIKECLPMTMLLSLFAIHAHQISLVALTGLPPPMSRLHSLHLLLLPLRNFSSPH